MRTTKDLLDPAVDVCISYLCGRHACSLLHSGGIVIGTVYDDRIVVSSDERWPLPRGIPPSASAGKTAPRLSRNRPERSAHRSQNKPRFVPTGTSASIAPNKTEIR